MRTGTGQELPLNEEPVLAEIYGEFARIEQAERNAASGISLLALANRATPRATLLEPPVTPPENSAALAPGVEKMSEPEPIEAEQPAPFSEVVVEKNETPEPAAEASIAPRREVVRPEEDREFPL